MEAMSHDTYTLSGDEHPHVPKACFNDWDEICDFHIVHPPLLIPAGH